MRPRDVRRFRWPRGVEEKVDAKHGFDADEVEDAFYDPDARVRRGRHGFYYLLSRTPSGAFVFVVFAYASGVATIITARPMTLTERRMHARK
jgi:uncharacterized DUF497 family protein